MRIAVISCWKYRDALKPFFALFNKFWPDCPYPVTVLTDYYEGGGWVPRGVPIFTLNGPSEWCEVLAAYTRHLDGIEDEIILFQEDMLLNAPVEQSLIDHALYMKIIHDAGCVRLYPCPGAEQDCGDGYFGIVTRGTRYRVSCQVGMWDRKYLHALADRYNTPQEFELQGTPYSNELPQEVLAFKRDVHPYPISYECTAIVNGKWTQSAKKLCDAHGIEVDWSLRELAPA